MRKLLEVIVYTLYVHHGLLAPVHGQRLLLHALRGHLHLWKGLYLGQQRVVGIGRLAHSGYNLQLWVEVSEQRGHKVVEAVEQDRKSTRLNSSHANISY